VRQQVAVQGERRGEEWPIRVFGMVGCHLAVEELGFWIRGGSGGQW
jgi:hypothetical protein